MTPPKLTHDLDQFQEAIKALPPVLKAYHSALVESGFTEPVALRLTIDLQRALLKYEPEMVL